jgi:nucleoside-diphosphate-sugar epimerase
VTRVLVTGAAGFIGGALVRRLLDDGIGGRPVQALVASDLALPDPLRDDPRVVAVEGSIADAAVLARATAEPLQVVFHLASVPGGAAERDPDLGRRVNLDATAQLLVRLRTLGGCPRLVFASTVAVYGDPLPAQVDEDTPAAPAMSYGAQKLAAEVLIADADRRGWVQACSLRLPGIVARPGDGAGLMSAFMSQLFWGLRERRAVCLPVRRDGTAWWASVGACVDNLLHAAVIDPGSLGPQRVVQMPALWLAMHEVVDAAAEAAGVDADALVRYEPQETVQRLFASLPPLRTPRAEALGFRHDGSARRLAARATSAQCAGVNTFAAASSPMRRPIAAAVSTEKR